MLLDVSEILDHAHAVLRTIAFIQMLDPVAGVAVAAVAEPEPLGGDHFTVLDPAVHAGLRFESCIASAARADIAIPNVSAAQPAVHPAGRDQARGNLVCLDHSFSSLREFRNSWRLLHKNRAQCHGTMSLRGKRSLFDEAISR